MSSKAQSSDQTENVVGKQPMDLTPEKPLEAEMASTGEDTCDSQMPGGTSGRTSPASSTGQSSDVSLPAEDDAAVITESMLAEEEKLKKTTQEEDDSQKTEVGDSWKTELEEQRYKRLQHLLQKSSIYTNFLLAKMEDQQQKERKRQERQMAKKREEEKKQKEAEANKSSKETSTPKRSRRGKKGQDEQDSQESKSSQEETKKKSSKADKSQRGQKRKAETYSIADYLDKDTLSHQTKKQKDETGKDKETTQPVDTESSEQVQKSSDASKEDFVDTYSRVINGEKVSDRQPTLFTGGVLRSYQLEGMEWLKVLYENGVNGILGDEMGLGKTIQCIALFAYIIEMGVPGPFLVCAPLSTLPNWVSEFQRFTPKIPVILYHGSKEERTKKRRLIRRKVGEYNSHPIVITSYEIVMNDRVHLQTMLWKYVIVDEGHRIKNLNCRLIRELKMYQTANRLLLTGTPLQNNLAELWSMLNFLLPEVFDDLNTFQSWFDFSTLSKEGGDEAIIAQEREQHVVSMLHQILTPFLLRRLKADVDLLIPPKKELLVHAPLTKKQEHFYKHTLDKTILERIQAKQEKEVVQPVELTPSGRPKRSSRTKAVNYAMMMDSKKDKDSEEDIIKWAEEMERQLEREEEAAKMKKNKKKTGVSAESEVNIKLQNVMMQLRKCCSHPYLLEYPLDPATGDYRMDEELVTSSGKMLVVDRLLPALRKRGHKVLIFSQMTKMLDIIEDYCHLRKFKYCRLDGSTAIEDRQERMKEFNSNPEMFLFLLSTRAGGLGINLTAADTVIIYDSDWNPQSDLQAQDRCHRIGQSKPVVIYRLVTSNTIDQKVVERAAAKRKLEKMVIHQGKFKGGKTNLEKDTKALINPKELLALLRSADHSGEVKNCREKGISNKDLELLLDRSDLLEEQEGQRRKRASAVKEVPGLFKVTGEEAEEDEQEECPQTKIGMERVESSVAKGAQELTISA
ncbi:lymphoid-specific helicase-like [Diadema antillarum]|uniref:lymphoid-specific helicase-like n=1 Tax=Diadema antillarum TaxID=105358 RepID=UPI003A8848F3